MANPTFDHDRAARLLIEAAIIGDKATARKHGIALRTLQRWRVKLAGDVELSSELSQAIAEKTRELDKAWADGIGDALRDGIRFLGRAFKEADVKDPAAIHAVAGALKLLAEAETTQRVLDARLARETRPVPAVEGARVQ
jgi:hypothetical protein